MEFYGEFRMPRERLSSEFEFGDLLQANKLHMRSPQLSRTFGHVRAWGNLFQAQSSAYAQLHSSRIFAMCGPGVISSKPIGCIFATPQLQNLCYVRTWGNLLVFRTVYNAW